jgi:hypothetical protein
MTPRWLLTATLTLAACTSPRELVLSIDSTAGVPCDIDRIRIVATSAGTTTFEQSLKGARLPVNVTLLDDTPSGSFQIEITGLKGDVEVMQTHGPLQFAGHKTTASVLLEPRCTKEAQCALSESMADAAAGPGPALECGANVTRYDTSVAVDSAPDACQVFGAQHALLDNSLVPVPLTALKDTLAASDFQFYGRPVRQVWVARNGYLSFAQDNPDPGGSILPGPFDLDITHVGAPPPRQSVMAFWDKLSLRSTGVCYEVDGNPGTQQLRVTWAGACLTTVCGSDDLNFTITLEETGRVLISYGKMSANNTDRALGNMATVGLVNDATGCPATDCTLATGLCTDGRTPCGYSQVFSNMPQSPRIENRQFTPVVDPD